MDPTVSHLLDAYEADREPVVVSVRRLRSSIAPLRARLGALPISALDHDAMTGYVRDRCAEGACPQTCRRELISLRAALRLAWRVRRIASPPYVPMPAPGSPRQRVLSAAEVNVVIEAALDDWSLLFLALLVATGARIEALSELTWDRVDLVAGVIDLRAPHPRAERRKHRAVAPISPRLAAVLTRARVGAKPNERVLGCFDTTLRRRLSRLAVRARIDGVTPHVFRHTAATELLRHVPLVMASRMIGYRSVAVTEQVYGHLTVGDLLPAAAVLDGLLAGIAPSEGRAA